MTCDEFRHPPPFFSSTAAERAAMVRHMMTCPDCRAFADRMVKAERQAIGPLTAEDKSAVDAVGDRDVQDPEVIATIFPRNP